MISGLSSRLFYNFVTVTTTAIYFQLCYIEERVFQERSCVEKKTQTGVCVYK
jgi:hypothetical protein